MSRYLVAVKTKSGTHFVAEITCTLEEIQEKAQLIKIGTTVYDGPDGEQIPVQSVLICEVIGDSEIYPPVKALIGELTREIEHREHTLRKGFSA